MQFARLGISTYLLFASVLIFASPSLADAIGPFIGHWEDSEYNCTLASNERRTGSYLVVFPADGSEDIATLSHGDYEAEGGGCDLRNPVKSGPKVELDAMCRFEEFESSPTKLEFSLVYDDEHLAVLDKRYSALRFYTLCNRDPDSWRSDPEPGPETHTTGTLNPPDVFWWLAEAYCEQEYNADSQYVRSGECERKIEDCKLDPKGSDCPSFQKCEYWRKGELVSEAACGLTTRVSVIGNRSNWIWQNGNRVTINFNAKTNEPRWGGKEVVVSNVSGDETCYEITASSERFCAMPHLWFFEW
ncbi:hypothetical protein [Hoeflea sp.]|uniref:hypothetical protein n=1 Tax=Hoeflea sp. TaxID=1940281 RepID=UPI003B529DDB